MTGFDNLPALSSTNSAYIQCLQKCKGENVPYIRSNSRTMGMLSYSSSKPQLKPQARQICGTSCHSQAEWQRCVNSLLGEATWMNYSLFFKTNPHLPCQRQHHKQCPLFLAMREKQGEQKTANARLPELPLLLSTLFNFCFYDQKKIHSLLFLVSFTEGEVKG